MLYEVTRSPARSLRTLLMAKKLSSKTISATSHTCSYHYCYRLYMSYEVTALF